MSPTFDTTINSFPTVSSRTRKLILRKAHHWPPLSRAHQTATNSLSWSSSTSLSSSLLDVSLSSKSEMAGKRNFRDRSDPSQLDVGYVTSKALNNNSDPPQSRCHFRLNIFVKRQLGWLQFHTKSKRRAPSTMYNPLLIWGQDFNSSPSGQKSDTNDLLMSLWLMKISILKCWHRWRMFVCMVRGSRA